MLNVRLAVTPRSRQTFAFLRRRAKRSLSPVWSWSSKLASPLTMFSLTARRLQNTNKSIHIFAMASLLQAKQQYLAACSRITNLLIFAPPFPASKEKNSVIFSPRYWPLKWSLLVALRPSLLGRCAPGYFAVRSSSMRSNLTVKRDGRANVGRAHVPDNPQHRETRASVPAGTGHPFPLDGGRLGWG